MTGIARSRRQEKTQQSKRPPRFFGEDVVSRMYGRREGARPAVVFGLGCETEDLDDYAERLREAVSLRVTGAESVIGLDVMSAHGVIGRLATTWGDEMVAIAAADLDMLGAEQLVISIFSVTDPLAPPIDVVLPVTYLDLDDDTFHGEPLVIGTGSFASVTIDKHNGAICVQRFDSAEEAASQHARNAEADMPFVGLEMN